MHEYTNGKTDAMQSN